MYQRIVPMYFITSFYQIVPIKAFQKFNFCFVEDWTDHSFSHRDADALPNHSCFSYLLCFRQDERVRARGWGQSLETGKKGGGGVGRVEDGQAIRSRNSKFTTNSTHSCKRKVFLSLFLCFTQSLSLSNTHTDIIFTVFAQKLKVCFCQNPLIETKIGDVKCVCVL